MSRDVISFLGDGYEFSQGNCLILKLVKKNRYLHDAGHQHIVILFSYDLDQCPSIYLIKVDDSRNCRDYFQGYW